MIRCALNRPRWVNWGGEEVCPVCWTERSYHRPLGWHLVRAIR